MGFRILGFCLILTTTLSHAQGRKPAVEDFVGIEIEEAYATPHGTESLFNLEQDINKINEQKSRSKSSEAPLFAQSQGEGFSSIFGISLVLGLPLMIWFMLMSHLKKKASLESASNIEVLEKYRKERERKSEEAVRKVS
jgi:hypothetical protein